MNLSFYFSLCVLNGGVGDENKLVYGVAPEPDTLDFLHANACVR